MIKVKLLYCDSMPPEKAKHSDAGFDLKAYFPCCVEPGKRIIVKTGIALQIPEGYYGRVAPRSGLAAKHGIDVLAGVIDSGYRDEIGVVLINHGNMPFDINKGDRIAQIIIEKIHESNSMIEVKDLDSSERGEGGFGSTGVK